MCGLSKPRIGGPLDIVRKPLHDAVLSKSLLQCVSSFQAACGVVPVPGGGRPSNAVLHALFSVASTLGDETFYTVALPLCAWMLDLELSRRLAVFWASVYYVGQAAKEVLRLPRPPEPVLRLEHNYSAEYGLPSTHTMGSLIPLFLAACHHQTKGSATAAATAVAGAAAAPLPPLLLWSCLAWSLAIATSRMYMGVHSIPDILAGYVLGGCLLTFCLTFGSVVDDFIVESPRAWWVVLGVAGASILAYPCPERWTNSFGDTTIIVATAAGFLEACCLLHRGGGRGGDTLQVLEDVHLISSGRAEAYGWPALVADVRRCGLGFLVLLPMRSVLKYCCRGLLSALLVRSPGWPKSEARRRHTADIPSKVVVYGCMGFSSCYLVPRLWLWLGLEEDPPRE